MYLHQPSPNVMTVSKIVQAQSLPKIAPESFAEEFVLRRIISGVVTDYTNDTTS